MNFCFHRKDVWSDILVFDFVSTSHLLQGRKCKKCLATEFRIVSAKGFMGAPACGSLTEGHLESAHLWSSETKISPKDSTVVM